MLGDEAEVHRLPDDNPGYMLKTHYEARGDTQWGIRIADPSDEKSLLSIMYQVASDSPIDFFDFFLDTESAHLLRRPQWLNMLERALKSSDDVLVEAAAAQGGLKYVTDF